MVSLENLCRLLVEAVPNDSSFVLLNKCKALGMTETEYLEVDMDSNLPDFDKGYHLLTETDDSMQARIEILERGEDVLQVGFQVTYQRTFFFSKSKKHYKMIKPIANDFYGKHFPMKAKDVEILNYGNESSVCYLSLTNMNGVDSITFRIGNRKYW
ncbi:MAG: hypothetical protein QQN41_09180 [Nitrosopumilus sp.]